LTQQALPKEVQPEKIEIVPKKCLGLCHRHGIPTQFVSPRFGVFPHQPAAGGVCARGGRGYYLTSFLDSPTLNQLPMWRSLPVKAG